MTDIVTTDPAVVRAWIEARGGVPATKRGSGEPVGILRVHFPGFTISDKVVPISWEDFFAKLREKDLAFLCHERTRDGRLSRYCRFVRRAA